MPQRFSTYQAQESLRKLRDELMLRKKRMVDAAFLEDMGFGPIENLSFTVKANWKKNELISGDSGSYRKVFNTGNAMVRQMRGNCFVHRRSFCGFADDIISDILRLRGVSK